MSGKNRNKKQKMLGNPQEVKPKIVEILKRSGIRKQKRNVGNPQKENNTLGNPQEGRNKNKKRYNQ